jgi:hypothetical protein
MCCSLKSPAGPRPARFLDAAAAARATETGVTEEVEASDVPRKTLGKSRKRPANAYRTRRGAHTRATALEHAARSGVASDESLKQNWRDR